MKPSSTSKDGFAVNIELAQPRAISCALSPPDVEDQYF